MSAALPAIREEVIKALREAEAPLTRAELLERCPTAENAQWVSIALNTLKKGGVVERTEHGWTLTVTGRGDSANVFREDEARAIEKAPKADVPAPRRDRLPPLPEDPWTPEDLPRSRAGSGSTAGLYPPKFGDDEADPLLERIRHMRDTVPAIAEPDRKARILREIAKWPAMDGEVANYLLQIAADLEGLAA